MLEQVIDLTVRFASLGDNDAEAGGKRFDRAPAADVIPPKPPVDIDLGFGGSDEDAVAESSTADKENEPEDDFAQTVVMPPPGGSQPEDNSRNSTDAFIARVKEQLSSSDPVKDPDAEQDYSSTVPQ